MTRIQMLIFLIIFPVLIISQSKNDPLYSAYNVTKIEYLAHKYQPKFAPCKYGVVKGFDQPHFVVDPLNNLFEEEFSCCEACETLKILLGPVPYPAKMCCKPETGWKHEKWATRYVMNDKKLTPELINSLGYVFDDITPSDMDLYTYRKDKNVPRVGTGSYGYIFVGAAIAQAIIAAMIGICWYFCINQRIALECVPDCDYEIEQEVKLFNPSKSAMMSDNMNSDLMSMSQGAI